MKKTLLSTLAVALLLGAARLPAQEKPVAVVSIPSYDELMADIGYLGELGDNPGLPEMLEGLLAFFTQGKGLDGLDKTQPAGALIGFDQGPSVVAFLPVEDTDKLLTALAAFVRDPEDAGDGVTKVTVAEREFFVKPTEGWAFVAQTAEELAETPADPLKLLQGLDKSYDIGARLYVQNIPEMFRELAVVQMTQGLEGALEPLEGETEEEFQARKAVAMKQLERVGKVIEETDQLTLGLAIDREARKLFLDLEITALAGTDSAAQFAQLANVKTKLGGLNQPDAMFTFGVTGPIPEDDLEQTQQTVEGVRKQLLSRIDKSDDFPDDAGKEKAKELVNRGIDVVDDTLKGGHFDLGAAVLGRGPITFAVGMHVADGKAAESVILDFAKLAQADGTLAAVEENVDEVGGVRIHRIVPKDEVPEEARQILGENPEIIVGIGPQTVYLLVGDSPTSVLEGILAKNEADADKKVGPFHLSLALGPVMKLAAAGDAADPNVALMATILEDAQGLDHVRVSVSPRPNGERIRIEVEEGILKMISTLAAAAQKAGGLGGGEL